MRPGELVCVVGPVGVGKSALLAALLGEMHHSPLGGGGEEGDAPAAGSAGVVDAASPAADRAGPGGGAGAAGRGAGRVAYCAQSAWLPSATVRDAVVFGRDPATGAESGVTGGTGGLCGTGGLGRSGSADEVWYRKVVAACQLDQDLALLPEGDDTEVGDTALARVRGRAGAFGGRGSLVGKCGRGSLVGKCGPRAAFGSVALQGGHQGCGGARARRGQ